MNANAELIVAAMDLKLVRLLRQAMHPSCSCGRSARGNTAPAHQPQPRIEPRRVIHPQARIEPRPVIHVPSRVIEQPSATPTEPEQPSRLRSPIQPPWKILPWQTPIPPRPKIKVVLHRPDIISKGSLIDFFI